MMEKKQCRAEGYILSHGSRSPSMMVGEKKHEELKIAGSVASLIKKQSDKSCFYSDWDSSPWNGVYHI